MSKFPFIDKGSVFKCMTCQSPVLRANNDIYINDLVWHKVSYLQNHVVGELARCKKCMDSLVGFTMPSNWEKA